MYSFFLEKRTIVPGQLEEARLVADGKVDVVVNCGDDGNGCTVTAYIHIPVLRAHLRYDCSNSLRTERISYRF